MTKDIFISYRRQDSAFFAARLRDRLEQSFPGQVFLDVSGIDAGDDFVDKLKSAVAVSKALVAVIGPGWASRPDDKSRLGEPGDYLTEEIAAALEAGIAVVPVLIEAAQMPAEDELPPRLRGLHRRHAIVVSHARFESDANHLVAALYKPLGISPPNRLERIFELLGGGTRFNQRTRDQCALISLGAAAFGAFLAALWFVDSRSEPLDLLPPLGAGGLALALGIIGRNSLRRRWAALGGIAVSVLTLTVCLALSGWRVTELPREPWLEAGRLAQLHAHLPELPPDAIVWSPRAPFSMPLPPPTVECACFAMEEKPPVARPYPAGAQVTLRNRCAGPVTFAAARSTSADFVGLYPWFAASGREFAVVTLAPGQHVRLPIAGTYENFFLPWVCVKEWPVKP